MTTPESESRRRLLLVEDDDIQRRGVVDCLHEAMPEIDIALAENGGVAWELLQKRLEVHAILSDFQMPEVDGLELLQLVRSDPTLKEIAFILMSGNTSALVEAAEERNIKLPGRVLGKPLIESRLIRTVRQELGLE